MAKCHALENKNALRLHVHLQEKGMKKARADDRSERAM